MNLFDLTGRVAVITGGNGGLGLAIALGMAEAGASVVIAARNAAKAEKALATLHQAGAKAIFIETHVEDEESCEALMRAAER